MGRRRWLLAGLAAMLIAAAGLAWLQPAGGRSPIYQLEVDLQESSGTFAQLFWASDFGFTEERSIRLSLSPSRPLASDSEPQRLRFPFPARGVRWLRLDPTDASGSVLVARMQLFDDRHQLLRTFDAVALKAANQIRSITQEGEAIRLTTAEGATDAFLFAALGCGAAAGPAEALSLVDARGATLAFLALIAVLLAGVVSLGRTVIKADPSAAAPQANGSARSVGAWIAVFGLLVVAVKLLVVHSFPLMVPFWDQWDAEARALYVPFSECGLSWGQMSALHNEHRVFFTRLLALGELLANGQWDPRLQQVVNAGLHTVTGALLVAMLWLAAGRRRLDVFVAVGILAFAPPFAWENVLQGFQSAFYFLLLFSLLGLWLTTQQPVLTPAWWLGWLCALAGLFTAAGGVLLAPAIVAAAALGDIWRRDWRHLGWTLALAAVIAAIGVATLSPPLAHHEMLRAKGVGDFIGALSRGLAWPFVTQPWAAIGMWAPLAVTVVVRVVRRQVPTPREQFVAGLATWVLLQAAAIAYGRGAGGPPPAPRYQDLLSVGFVVNAFALTALFAASQAPRLFHVGRILLGLWLVAAGAGIWVRTHHSLAELQTWRTLWDAETRHVRDFVQSGDRAAFTAYRGFELPHPDPEILATVLQDPYVRSILPPAARAPIRIEPAAVTNGAFAPIGAYPTTPRDAGVRSWGSFAADGNGSMGRFESGRLPPCGAGRSLSFPVAGYLGLPGLRLAIRDAGTGEEMAGTPSRMARESWTELRMPCPASGYSIVAVDERADYWFAFREPVEVGRLTPMAEGLIAASPTLALVGLVALILVARWL